MKKIFIVLALITFFATTCAEAKPSVKAELAVKADHTKLDGRAWDPLGGSPDLAVCIDIGYGKHCLPSGSSPKNIRDPGCRNGFLCKFHLHRVPRGDTYTITIVDVDLNFNDIVGSNICKVNKKCSFGAGSSFLWIP